MNIRRIIVADADSRAVEGVAGHLAEHGYEVFLAANAAELVQHALEYGCDLAIVELDLPDGNGLDAARRLTAEVPGIPVMLMGSAPTIERYADRILRAGLGYVQKPVGSLQALLAVRQAERARQLEDENRMLRSDWERDEGPEDLVFHSPLMVDVLRQAATAAETDAPVVVYGAPGTEKRIIALFIHRCSRRSDGPFVRFQCGQNSPCTEVAELFGRGHHSGSEAVRSGGGRLALACGGTLLLDGVERLSPRCQARLLRFLEEEPFTDAEPSRSWSAQPISPGHRPVRIIGSFSGEARPQELREDLFYRLSGLSITIPALGQRREDIVPLAHRLTERFADDLSKGVRGISPEAERLLESYDWPGNLAELKDTLRTAVLGARHAVLLPEDFLRGPSRVVHAGVIGGVTGPTLEDAERQLILKTLDQTRGNKAEAARRLRITPGTLNNKLNQYRSLGLFDAQSHLAKERK